MGSQLEQVKMVCCQLDDKRVNIRKKAHDQLRDLLNNSQIVATIDRVSVTGTARDWTWQDVYRCAYGFLKKEADKLLDDLSKESKSRSTHLANNKKIIAVSLFKMIIMSARKYLNWTSVVSDLLQCLEQPFMRKTFAEDIMSLLIEALNHDHSRSMLTVTKDRNQWEKILSSVLSIFEDPPASTDPLIAAQLLRLSLQHGREMTCLMDILSRDKVWRVLESALISQEFARADSEARLECVLAANAAMTTAGLECREAAVRLGEAAIRGVIPVWDLRRSGVKEAVLEFLLLQIILHHPGSVSEVREGAMYTDRLEWTRQLNRVQKNIIEIPIRNKMRQNKQKNSRLARDYNLSPELVRLGAEVVYQLDKAPLEARTGDVTQLVELDETQARQPGQAPAAKRRRLSGDGPQPSGLDSLVTEILKSVTLEEMKIPWLQILSELVARHPDVVRGNEEPFLELLSSQMSVTKSPSVREELCGILASICEGSGCGEPLWAGLAHSVLTLLGGNQLASAGHRLLRALLSRHDSVKLNPQEVFNVFRNKLVKLDMNSARTLTMLMAKSPINDVRDPRLREDLMSWISSQLVSEHNPLGDKALVPHLSILIKHLTHKNITESAEEADESKANPVLCRVDRLEKRLSEILCNKPLYAPKDLSSSKEQPESKALKMMGSADQLFISAAGHILDTLQANKEQSVRAGCHFLHTLASYLSSFPDSVRIKSLTINVFNDVQKALSKLVNLKEDEATEKMLPVLTSASAVMDSLSQIPLEMETKLSDIFVVKLKEMIKEICKAKKAFDARPSSRPASRAHSGSSTPDPFLDDFETMDSVSTNDDFADFEMANQNNPEKELHDIKFICESLKTISVFSNYSQAQASTQTWVIEILMEVLSVYDYNNQITEAFCTVIEKLVQTGMTIEAVEQTGDLFIDVAKNCMSKTSFKRHGMFALTKCIKALIPLLNKFDVQTRSISVKIVETLMKQNSLADDKRLDDGMLMNMVNVMEELSGLGVEASWAVWSVHNLVAPDLAVDTDEKLPIYHSLPGFLLSKHASVRILTGQVIVKLTDQAERKGAILKKRLLPVIESNRLYGGTHSALLAALGCLNLTFAVPVTSTLIRIQAENRTGFNNEQLKRAISLVKAKYDVDILKVSLPLCMEEYLRFGFKLDSFPISLYQNDQLVGFIEDNETEIVPLILLQEPKKQTLEKLAALLKRSPESVMKNNFASVARYFIPGMVAQDSGLDIEGKERLVKLANFVESLQIPDKNGERSGPFGLKILGYLKSTISRIFLGVNDTATMATVFKIKKQEQIPAYPLELTGDMPSRVMNLLGANTEKHIWEEITVINSNYMANIAISITSTLSEKESAENNLRTVFSLYLWIDSISKKFTDEMVHVLSFLVKYISSNLLKLLNCSSRCPVQIMEDLSKAILLTLFKLLKFSMDTDASSIESSLKNINYGLVNCLNQSSWREETDHIALEILTFLLIQNGPRFKEIILNIEDFPPKDTFDKLSCLIKKERQLDTSLSRCFERFLATYSSTSHTYLNWPLQVLCESLKRAHVEISLVPGESLMAVVHSLLILSRKSDSISEEAMSCLAEIGPIEFKSELLVSDSQVNVGSSTPVDVIISKLLEILFKSEGELARVCGITLADILAHPYGRDHMMSTCDTQGKQILLAFQKSGPKLKGSKGFDEGKVNIIDDSDLWNVSGKPHQEWIVSLVNKFLACYPIGSLYHCLTKSCSLSPELCETVLKFLIYDSLSTHSDDVSIILSHRINKFFNDHFESLENTGLAVSQPPRSDSLRVMVSVIQYLRLRGETGNNCWSNNFLLANVNYCHLAAAALTTGDNFLALNLASVWCHQQSLARGWGTSEEAFTDNMMEEIVASGGREAVRLLEIMFTASQNIGDKDRAMGLGRFMIHDPRSRIANLLLEGRTELAASLCDSGLTAGADVSSGLVTSLHSMGLHHTLASYIQQAEVCTDQMREIQQECSWRLEAWDKLCPEEATKSFNGCVLGGLESCLRSQSEELSFWHKAGLNIVRSDIERLGIESSSGVYPVLSKLRQLSELVRLGDRKNISNVTIDDLLEKDNLPCSDFKHLEPILTQRLILLSRHGRKFLGDMTLSTSKRAREAHQLWVCNRIQKFYTNLEPSVRLEGAHVIFSQGQMEAGILLAKKLLTELDEKDKSLRNCKILAKTNLSLGNWLNEQKSEANLKILEKYLLKSVSILEKNLNDSRDEDLIDAYLAVASLTDKLYIQTRNFLNSSQFKERNEAMERNKKEASILTKAVNKEKDLNLPRVIKERFCRLDSTEAEEYRKQLLDYLKMSLDNYLSVLMFGNRSLAVYRLVSLWFSDGNHDLGEVSVILHAKLPSVSSDKMVPLLYQMAARMSLPTSSETDFSSVLFQVMVRVSKDHPHHAIPIILALLHAKEDEQFVDGSRSGKNKENDPRASASSKVVNELEKKKELKDMVFRYKFLCKSLIELAYLKADANKSGNLTIPAGQNILKVKDWNDVTVLTDTIPVKINKDYSSICGISKFPNKFSMVGGVNAPKKILCNGLDGRERPQLVKGKDDLRQDAVMEQVFGLLNDLLKLNDETRKRKLNVRTYKVVPLSQRSGILEWCQNTQPIALFLEGHDKKSGAHKKYHPKELDSRSCRQEMNRVSKSSIQTKLKVFKAVCSKFSPAMKYFFYEKFPSPGSYHQSVTAYTRSVAVNSMVGHILGLGDRHTNNILIDNFTGEIIHIDLGVAFEQGRILPTPETIPFRLTRDMVDGFGPTGVEGVFRQCCEHSLRVLRDNSAAVQTVLEVLLHDPLYNWSVGPGRAASRQEAGQWEELQKENEGGNKMANRALLVLSSKLEGLEEGALLSVQGQVNVLVQRARDPENLCAVFEGWAQWC